MFFEPTDYGRTIFIPNEVVDVWKYLPHSLRLSAASYKSKDDFIELGVGTKGTKLLHSL